jgi:hypothetical protein
MAVLSIGCRVFKIFFISLQPSIVNIQLYSTTSCGRAKKNAGSAHEVAIPSKAWPIYGPGSGPGHNMFQGG